jgi:hypothetical protein
MTACPGGSGPYQALKLEGFPAMHGSVRVVFARDLSDAYRRYAPQRGLL